MLVKAVKIGTILIIIGFVGGCLYFVGGVSATIPPIRTYNLSGTVKEFGDALINLSKTDTNIKVDISRRDSSQVDDGSRDIAIKLIKDTTFNTYCLVCDPDNDKRSKIKLTSAFDKTNKKGGYGGTAQGVKPLLSDFEIYVLTRLKNIQHIVLQQDTSFWAKFSIY